jgi:hypothetical protein
MTIQPKEVSKISAWQFGVSSEVGSGTQNAPSVASAAGDLIFFSSQPHR